MAIQANLLVEYWEVGNNINADNTQLMTLTQDIEITDLVLAGGTALVAPIGASPLGFTPCVLGLRFWQVFMRFTILNGAGIAVEPYFI